MPGSMAPAEAPGSSAALGLSQLSAGQEGEPQCMRGHWDHRDRARHVGSEDSRLLPYTPRSSGEAVSPHTHMYNVVQPMCVLVCMFVVACVACRRVYLAHMSHVSCSCMCTWNMCLCYTYAHKHMLRDR